MKTTLTITKKEIRSYMGMNILWGLIYFGLGIYTQITFDTYIYWIAWVFTFAFSVGGNIFIRKNYYKYDSTTIMEIDDETRIIHYTRKQHSMQFSIDDIESLEYMESFFALGDYYVILHLKKNKEVLVSCSLIGSHQLSHLLPHIESENNRTSILPLMPCEED